PGRVLSTRDRSRGCGGAEVRQLPVPARGHGRHIATRLAEHRVPRLRPRDEPPRPDVVRRLRGRTGRAAGAATGGPRYRRLNSSRVVTAAAPSPDSAPNSAGRPYGYSSMHRGALLKVNASRGAPC